MQGARFAVCGLRFALLFHDLIPVRRPEWCDRVAVRSFRYWIDNTMPLCDTVFALSRATAADVESYAREQRIRLPGAVVVLPLGSELAQPPGARSARLPPPGSYALTVSTIEARTNHLLPHQARVQVGVLVGNRRCVAGRIGQSAGLRSSAGDRADCRGAETRPHRSKRGGQAAITGRCAGQRCVPLTLVSPDASSVVSLISSNLLI